MRAEVVGVGTEILLGQIANDNARYISERLAEVGVDVLYHRAVGDNLDRIAGNYGRQGPAQRQARSIRARLQNSRMDEIFQTGLHEFIGAFVDDNNRLGSALTQQYLA